MQLTWVDGLGVSFEEAKELTDIGVRSVSLTGRSSFKTQMVAEGPHSSPRGRCTG